MSSWQFVDITSATGAPNLLSVGWPPVAYPVNAQGTQHVYYLAGQLKGGGATIAYATVNELWRAARHWHHTNLSDTMRIPLLVPAAGYAFNAGGTRHVICLAGDLHIHELRADSNGWHHTDLTAKTGAPVGYPMCGYALESQGTQHVIYLDDAPTDRHIRELWWDATGWHHNDLTAATGAPIGNAVGYAFEAQLTQHIVYSGGADSHIHELWWDTSGWHHNDLTVATGAPVPTWPFVRAHMFDLQATQHVVFLVGDHIHELWWDSTGWHHGDVTAAAKAPVAAVNATPVAFAANGQGTRYVVYQGSGNDDHIHELWWDASGWHHHDLTIATGAPPAAPTAGYVVEPKGTQHIICIGQANVAAQQELVYELRGPTQQPVPPPKPPKPVVPPFPKKPHPPFS